MSASANPDPLPRQMQNWIRVIRSLLHMKPPTRRGSRKLRIKHASSHFQPPVSGLSLRSALSEFGRDPRHHCAQDAQDGQLAESTTREGLAEEASAAEAEAEEALAAEAQRNMFSEERLQRWRRLIEHFEVKMDEQFDRTMQILSLVSAWARAAREDHVAIVCCIGRLAQAVRDKRHWLRTRQMRDYWPWPPPPPPRPEGSRGGLGRGGAEASEASASDSEEEGFLVQELLPLRLPLCRCSQQDITTSLWVPGEREGRCYECANRVDMARLSPLARFAYLLLRLLWAHQFYRERWPGVE